MGRFERTPQPLYGTKRRRVFEEFANWPDTSQDILRFTRKYGPLEDRPAAGGSFRFQLAAWRDNHEGFRFLWSLVQRGESIGALTKLNEEPLVAFGPAQGRILAVDANERWAYSDATLSYRAANLWRLLVFNLLSYPQERLRKCARPDCKNPYFIARHLKQRYCSEPCVKSARAQWKRDWWTQHGKDWRANQRKTTSRKRR